MDMLLHRRMLVLVVGAALALAVALAATRDASAAPPETFEDAFPVEGVCDFPVLLEVSGKSKFIELPDGRSIVTAPSLRVTLTNLDKPANSASYVITGAFHQRELAGGRLLVVATGRNLLFDPSLGMFLTVGRVAFEVDEDGSVTPLEDTGRIIDVCARLA